MSENHVENEQLKTPVSESEPTSPSVTMEIQKEAKQAKKRSTKEFLDDHVQKDFGQSLVDSISRLISESKEEAQKKPIKKKKKMTPEMLEQCRRYLAKGRETLRKKKQGQANTPAPPKAEPAPKPVEAKPEPAPAPKPAPKPVVYQPEPEPEPEHLVFGISDSLF